MTAENALKPPMWREDPDAPLKDAAWTTKFLHHPVAFNSLPYGCHFSAT
jgi:hypothetical protein